MSMTFIDMACNGTGISDTTKILKIGINIIP
ncbi:IS1-like element transposase [Serratia sp. D1N4]